ncbi:MAG: ABC transporter ATP-binding protein [Deltaproteobacteria bacterium]|nr:MAG: ABC transporter ATP-binding protein [Deltaproteobacteria bacterium]
MSEGTKTVIETRGLTRVYRQGKVEVRALDGVDLRVAAGEFTALAGPSGSGKSTLLNLIGVLDTPTAGVVIVDGHELGKMTRSEAARFRLERVGFVFQAYNLLPVLTAYENAEYILFLQGVHKKEREARVLPLLERVGLADMKDRRPHELSGGQQQRVAVVRAIAARPAFVLADEPTANLDSKTSAALLEVMYELNQSAGTTFVLASHDQIVMERARRVVHLLDGRIESDEVKEAA